MPDDTRYDDAIAAAGPSDAQAQRNLQSTQGVSPENAILAFHAAPHTGVPPSLAQHTDMAPSQYDRAILEANPGVSQWVASSPNRAAASRDDLPGLSNVALKLNSFMEAPWTQWWNSAKALAAQTQAQEKAEQAKPGLNQFLDIFGPDELRGGAQLLNVAGLAQQGLSNIAMGPIAPLVTQEHLWLQQALGESNYKKLNDIIGTAMWGIAPYVKGGLPAPLELGGGELGATVPKAPVEYPPNVVRDGFGNPMEFNSAREAATFGTRDRPSAQGSHYEIHGLQNGKFALNEVQPAATGAPPPGFTPETDEAHSIVADADAAMIKQAEDAIAESKLHGRSPQMMQEFLQEIGASDRTAHVDPEALYNIYASGEQPFLSRVNQIDSALSTGGEVHIPLDEYLTEVAGKPYADELRKATRFSDEGISQADAEDLSAANEEIEGKPGINVRRMATMLGPQLYGDLSDVANVSAKEVLQNSFDAIKQAMAQTGLVKGDINVELDRSNRLITFHDNGVGMAPELLGGKFLQIAGSEKGENASGGFGIAKMQFLYGNETIHVQTMKDGVFSEMLTSGPDLMNALEEGGAKPVIKVSRGDEITAEQKALFPEGHGTRISLQIPKEFTDTKGEKQNIDFPYDVHDIPALKYSPLFGNVEVSQTMYGSKEPVQNVGTTFPKDKFTTFANVKFPWGTARIYISKEPSGKSWERNFHVLSNGLWQFSESLPANPSEPYGKKLPYTIYADVNPDVKPDEQGYPFGFNRQGFTEKAKEDFAQIKKYIQAVYGAKELQTSAESFATFHYLNRGQLTEAENLKPTVPQTENAFSNLKEGDSVEIKDGKLIVNGKVIPEMTPDELKAAVPKADELKVSQDLIDPRKVILHDNTVSEDTMLGEFGLTFSDTMFDHYGQEWHGFLESVGNSFIKLRDEVVRVLGYPDLAKEGVGISFDKDYRGVSVKVPFSGMFINPVAYESENFLEGMYGVVGTMIHELAHHKVRSHNAAFPAEMQRIIYRLQANPNFDLNEFTQSFIERMELYKSMIIAARDAFNDGSFKNRGSSLSDGSKQSTADGGDEGAAEPGGGALEGGESRPQLSARTPTGAGPGEGGRSGSVPTPNEGSAGVLGAGTVVRINAAVDQAFHQQLIRQLFTDAAAAGMTKDQFARYSKRIEEARAAAKQKLIDKLTRQLRRERSPDWNAAVELHMEEALKEVENSPAVQAYKALRDPMFKLDRDTVQTNYPELAGELPSNLVKRNGADPDEVAELTHHNSGADLVQDLVFLKRAIDATGSKTLEAFVKLRARDLATGRAREEVGYDLSNEATLKEVTEALAEKPIESFLSEELQQLAKVSGLTLDKEVVKNEALRLFGEMQVGDATKIREFERAMWKTGRDAEIGLLKNKPIDAFLAKQKQLMNHYMLAEAHKLVREQAKFEAMAKRLAGRATFSTISQEYLNQIHQALKQLGYSVRRNAQELEDSLRGQSLDKFVEEKTSEGKELAVGPIPTTDSVKKLTVDTFRMVKDSIESLEHVGRKEMAAETLEKSIAFNEAVEEALAQLNAIGEKYTFDQLRSILANPLDVGRYARWADGSMVKPEQLLDWFDRDQRGIFNKVVTEPIQKAKHDQDDLETSVSKKIVAFAKTMPKGWQKSLKVKVDVPDLTFDREGIPETVVSTKKDIIAIALNWGNESNLDKLLRGYNWKYEDVEAALNKYMTADDWRFVEHTWELFSDLWPMAEAMYRRMSGIAPPKVQPREFAHAFGKSKGGYYPVVYDPWLAPRVGGKKGDMFDPRYARATPPNPYANARTGAAYPIELNLDLVPYRLGQVIHDITHREALINAEKFLLSPRIKQKLTFTFGPEYVDQLRPFLEYVANAKVFDDKALGFWANAIKTFRMNTTMVGLGFRMTTILKHGSAAAANSIAEVGAKDLAQATARFFQDPDKHIKEVMAKSGELRNRLSNWDREVREAYRATYRQQGALSVAKHYAFHGVGISDLMSAVPTWMAAYDQIMRATGGDEVAAVQGADKRVRQAHGASGSADLAAIQRSEDTAGGQLWKTLTMFISFMNHMYNRDRANIRLMTDASGRKNEGDFAGARRDFAKGLSRTMWYWIPVIALEAALFQPEKDFFKAMVKGVIWRVTSGVPILRDVIDALEHGADFEGSPVVHSVQTLIGTGEDAIAAAFGPQAMKEIGGKGHHVSKRWLQHSMESAGYISGYPLGAPGTALQYISDYATGREHPKDFGQFLSGITTGHQSK